MLIASAILNLGLLESIEIDNRPPLKVLGINAKNSAEYAVVDIACALYGFTLVPLYDTLGPQAVNYILEQTQMSSVFCTLATLKSLLKLEIVSNLKNLICFEAFGEEQLQQAKQKNLKIFAFSELFESGRQKHTDPLKVTPETVYVISYTSGTTGNPKGAMLTHRNALASITAQSWRYFRLHLHCRQRIRLVPLLFANGARLRKVRHARVPVPRRENRNLLRGCREGLVQF